MYLEESSTSSSSRNGTKFGGVVSPLLGLQIWKSPFGDFWLFSVAVTTPRPAVSLDLWLLKSDKLFRTVGNDLFLTFCWTPKNLQPSYG